MDDYRTAVKSWLQANPLRQWRVSNKYTLRDIGAAIGTGYHTIYRWESGMAFPGEKQFEALSELTESKNLQKEFREWKQQQPVIKKGE